MSRSRQGYALCLRCGLADSEDEQGSLPGIFKGHKRLRGGRLNDAEKFCPGNDEASWAIQRNVRLGVVTHTEVFELQLHDANGKPIDRIAAYTAAVALRRALCGTLGIEEAEVGVAVGVSRAAHREAAYSVYLYDTATGGAGYVRQITARLPELLRQARAALECPHDCDAACQGCLLTHNTQHHLADLNRHTAIALLSEPFLAALELPEELRAFGSSSRLEMEPLPLALNREWQQRTVDELRIYLGGKARDWEPLAWRLRDDLTRWQQTGATVRLIVPTATLNKLNGSQCDELAALIAYTGAELYRAPDLNRVADLPLLAELGDVNQRVRWAASKTDALIPRPAWGGGEAGGPFVRAVEVQSLSPVPESWRRLNPADFRPSAPGVIALMISRELNGPSATFGDRAWTLLEQRTPKLAERLAGAAPLQSVRYTDRYLRSPLAFLLLHSLLERLARYPGGLAAETVVQMDTAKLDRLGAEQPRLLFHDWRDGGDRRQVVETWFKETWPTFIWQEAPPRNLPHARELTLLWSEGECWTVRLDQGFGYWGAASRTRPEFPFEGEAARQINRLKQVSLIIEPLNPGYPTHWYCSGQGC